MLKFSKIWNNNKLMKENIEFFVLYFGNENLKMNRLFDKHVLQYQGTIMLQNNGIETSIFFNS